MDFSERVFKKAPKFYEVLLKAVLYTSILMIISLRFTEGAMAEYRSTTTQTSTARVAKFGELTFLEYTSDGNVLVTGTEAQFETINVKAGIDIPKQIAVSFQGSEVAVYVYLVVDTTNWTLHQDNNNILSIQNSYQEDIVSWTINNNWTYLTTETVDGKERYVYYHEVTPTTAFEDKVLETLEVNAISLDDSKLLENPSYSLGFKTYAISKVGIEPGVGWEHVKKTY